MTLLPGSTSHGLFLLADEHEHHEDVEDKNADGGDEKQENRVHLLGLLQGRTMARDILANPDRPSGSEALRGHCQVDEKRAQRALDDSVSIIVQQAHVTASQTRND